LLIHLSTIAPIIMPRAVEAFGSLRTLIIHISFSESIDHGNGIS
jgi:hypothetical protein